MKGIRYFVRVCVCCKYSCHWNVNYTMMFYKSRQGQKICLVASIFSIDVCPSAVTGERKKKKITSLPE